MNRKAVAVIPAYNEEETIGDVIAPLLVSEYIEEILVISDGSTDATAERARDAGARVVELEENVGKGDAMRTALQHTDADILAFFDADLIGLTEDHIERILLPVLHGARRMNVGIRDRGGLYLVVAQYLPLIGGERAMYRQILEAIPAEFMQGYMVESALNYWCRSHGFGYGSVVLPGLSIRRKDQKVGMRRAVVQYMQMWLQIFRAMLVVRLARRLGQFEDENVLVT